MHKVIRTVLVTAAAVVGAAALTVGAAMAVGAFDYHRRAGGPAGRAPRRLRATSSTARPAWSGPEH
ncbi:hypothetical protein ABT301_07080 [Streptomyces sp. NPDC000987]|uniref:hypothetical protein n=1 Tax=Streptomyces sp. NPDC000987 TaxID=3154374 RepID=UPI00332B97CA